MIMGMSDESARGGSAVCPRCQQALLPDDRPRQGRRRLWCSDACRRAAHAERRAAERAGMAVRVVEVPRASPAVRVPVLVARELTPEELVGQVLADPNTVRRLVWSLTARPGTRSWTARCVRTATNSPGYCCPMRRGTNASKYPAGFTDPPQTAARKGVGWVLDRRCFRISRCCSDIRSRAGQGGPW